MILVMNQILQERIQRFCIFQLLVAFVTLFFVGTVSATSLLVVGNSLTRHAPAKELDWHGDWGMAASSPDRDYVHLLAAKLEAQTREKVEVRFVAGYPLEVDFFKGASKKPVNVSSNSFDYVVLEIGDNVNFKNGSLKKFTLRYTNLLESLKKGLKPRGQLVCLGKWWANVAVDKQIKRACELHGGKFVGLSGISSLFGAKAKDERAISNVGVGEHPSDVGMHKIADAVFCAAMGCEYPPRTITTATEIGVYYFPGWQSTSRYWKDIRGLPGSRSPNSPWPDREPFLGYYAEEDVKVAEQHIDWASQYGVTFFAYDWYWGGNATYLNHAVDNYLSASNTFKLKFSLLWANHTGVPKNLFEFDSMVDYWFKNYFLLPQFYRIEDKPVVFVFSSKHLEVDAQKFGWTGNRLLMRANERAKSAGFNGIFFVSNNDNLPTNELEGRIREQGFSAYTGWCNVGVQEKSATSADYQVMVDAYLRNFEAAKKTSGTILYIPPVSPGRDSRPWLGKEATVRTNPSPAKFKQMLAGAKSLIDSGKKGVMPLVMIQSWNEFGEGAYIEPSKKFGFEYLDVTLDVLGK